MNLQEKLEKKVEEYNELVGRIEEVRKNLEAGEQERLLRLGQIQQLEELLREDQAETLKAESQGLSDSDEADEPESDPPKTDEAAR